MYRPTSCVLTALLLLPLLAQTVHGQVFPHAGDGRTVATKSKGEFEYEWDCPKNLSWRLVAEVPHQYPAYRVTDYLQDGCFEYIVNSTTVYMFPDEPLINAFPPTPHRINEAIFRADWDYMVDVNADHDTVNRKNRYYWAMDQKTLVTDGIYQRLFWDGYSQPAHVVETAQYQTSTTTVKASCDPDYVQIDQWFTSHFGDVVDKSFEVTATHSTKYGTILSPVRSSLPAFETNEEWENWLLPQIETNPPCAENK